MQRRLTAIFALLLALGGLAAAPVSRIAAGRDSSAIIWILREKAEPSRVSNRVRLHRRPAATGGVEYRSRLAGRIPLFDLFQRPPPIQG
ncbi:MAG TPA: hypothetical protein VE959_12390 [Bryobacteraceae bacterium]|nr:hypothetical protein [Bryobacteraceae bacterium]